MAGHLASSSIIPFEKPQSQINGQGDSKGQINASVISIAKFTLSITGVGGMEMPGSFFFEREVYKMYQGKLLLKVLK